MKYSIKEEMPGVWFLDLKVGGEEQYIGAYILLSGKEAALVEVGPFSTALNIIHAFDEIGLPPQNVKYLLLTHVHLDHGGAAGTLIKHLPNANVVAHKKGIPHLVDPEAVLWKASSKVLGFVADIYGKPEPIPEDKIIPIENKMSLTLGKCSFEIIPTPGHASHHVCFFLNPGKVIFTGDAAGTYLPGLDILLPQTPPPLRLEAMLKSLDALISLDPSVCAYTHFGVSPNAGANLKRHYNQLLVWYESVTEALNKGMAEEVIMDLISPRDKNLKKFLIYSEKLAGVKRGVELSIKGFLDFVLEERSKN
jgi:glyoxylase-like metal-dependent hydrolase (beta-lactamase superfamily II)